MPHLNACLFLLLLSPSPAAPDLSESRLLQSPKDEDALFANVLRLRLHADYLALIEKQNLAALREIRQATDEAEALLRLYPNCYDAYIAGGIENYLLSQKPAPCVVAARNRSPDRQGHWHREIEAYRVEGPLSAALCRTAACRRGVAGQKFR